jgi:hypothetical protein
MFLHVIKKFHLCSWNFGYDSMFNRFHNFAHFKHIFIQNLLQISNNNDDIGGD